MDQNSLDLLIAFIIREKRYLKKRETSFTDKELKEGEDILKRFLKAIATKKYPEDFLREAERNPNKTKKILRDIQPKLKSINRKQLLLLIQHYFLFFSVIEKKHKEHKIFVEAMKADRFYSPRRKVY